MNESGKIMKMQHNYTMPHTGCIYGSIQLVGGSNQYEGTVQLCKNDEWGTVCDYRWDSREAQVVCRQLGYDYDGGLISKLTRE